jgi:hypothetical protein
MMAPERQKPDSGRRRTRRAPALCAIGWLLLCMLGGLVWPAASTTSAAGEGTFAWAFILASMGSGDVWDVTTDSQGNVYTVGRFAGTADFDPGSETDERTSSGETDIFVASYTAAGALRWVRAMGGSEDDIGYAAATDAAGNVTVVGWFQGSADLSPGVDDDPVVSNGGTDMFIVQFDTDGTFRWARTIGGDNSDQALSLSVDSEGSIYVTGSFRGTGVDFDPGPDSALLNANPGGSDVFVLHLTAAGAFVWAGAMGGDNTDTGEDIALHPSGDLVVGGFFTSDGDFDPGPDTSTLEHNGSGDNPFVLRISPDGTLRWARAFATEFAGQANEVAVDAAGNIYVAGEFLGMGDFDPAPDASAERDSNQFDGFLTRLDAAGSFVWVRTFSGASGDQAVAVNSDSQGNIYTTGLFRDNLAVDNGSEVPFSLAGTGPNDLDVFITRHTAAGGLDWAYALIGPDNNEEMRGDVGRSIHFDPPTSGLYVAGVFRGSLDTDPAPDATFPLVTGGNSSFLVRLDLSTTDLLYLPLVSKGG